MFQLTALGLCCQRTALVHRGQTSSFPFPSPRWGTARGETVGHWCPCLNKFTQVKERIQNWFQCDLHVWSYVWINVQCTRALKTWSWWDLLGGGGEREMSRGEREEVDRKERRDSLQKFPLFLWTLLWYIQRAELNPSLLLPATPVIYIHAHARLYTVYWIHSS